MADTGVTCSRSPESNSPPCAVRISGLGFQRGDRWLFRGLDLEVAPGTFVAIVGPSGVGKTTLLSCLCGMLEPTEGSVSLCINGTRDRLHPASLRSRCGIVFQQLQLTRNLDLLTNVMCGRLAEFSWMRTLFGFPSRLREEAYRILVDLDVARNPHKWVSELSGGEQQRVAVARALFQAPDFFFTDEPVSNLDAYYAGRVLGLLQQQARSRGGVVFCVLHHAELIQRFADIALSINPKDPHAWRVRTIRKPAAEEPVP